MNIARIITDNANSFQHKTALIFEDKTVTYHELDENSNRIASGLLKSGIAEGDRVALMLSNHPSFVTTYFAIQKAGAVAVLINPSFKASEVTFILNDSQSTGLVTTGVLRNNVIVSELPHLKHIILTEGSLKKKDLLLADLIENISPDPQLADLSDDSPSTILYTSGTTGFPKGAVLSHGNLATTARLCTDGFRMNIDERVLIFLPVCHSFGLTTILIPSLKAGTAVVLHAESDNDSILRSVLKQKITIFLAVPTIYNILCNTASTHDMQSVKQFISAGATLPSEVGRRWKEKFGIPISEGLGFSEGSLVSLNHNPFDKPGSIGRPFAGVEMKVVDNEGNEVKTAESGEIIVRGTNVMLGYWNRPDATAEAIKDGWFYTGDIGRKDADDYFYITDRRKDMVSVGGENVWPSEVENLLYRHPAVAEAAVYGMPEPVLGERVWAEIILKPGQAVSAEKLDEFCRQSLADYKVPSVIKFVSSLPKGKTGKILKRVMREEALKSSHKEHSRLSFDRSPEQVAKWLKKWLSEKLDIRDDLIVPDKPFSDYGLTSVLAVNMVIDLNEWSGKSFEAIIVWSYPTIDSLVAYITKQAAEPSEETLRMKFWPAIDPYHVYDALMYDRMMNDQDRIHKFRLAIEKTVADKVVLQIGPGETAILPRMCAKAGAARIYAVEIGKQAFQKARAMVEKLGLTDKIKVIHGDATKVSLPEPADVCVSGLAGQIGGSEGVTVIINQIRHLLKPSSVVIPQRCVSNIAAVTLPDELVLNPQFNSLGWHYTNKIFEQVGNPFDLRVIISNFEKTSIISDKAIFENLDFSGPVPTRFEHEISLTINRKTRLDGFVIWLNLHTLEGIVIDILDNGGSWLPIYLPVFSTGIEVSTGDIIEASCIGTLSDNQINPDYRIKGKLIRQNGMQVEFDHFFPHHGKDFQNSLFYKKLFEEQADNFAENEFTKPATSELVNPTPYSIPDDSEPIAIIGIGCRFPGGADTPDKFWNNLKNGVDTMSEIPPDRWDFQNYYDPKPGTPGKMYIQEISCVNDIDRFDPLFFGMSPKEAAGIDPQQRLIIETCWKALEHSAVNPDDLPNSQTGVFIGEFWDDYSAQRLYAEDEHRIDSYCTLSNMRGFAAARPAYILGLQGPVIQLDTSCSSSLLAVHLACQSLRSQECNMALAGGVHLTLSPRLPIALCQMRVMSKDGRCKTFDAGADGFGIGEGCGIVVLKRQSDAIRDNDNILALIRGSAVNHDGSSNGLTAPSGPAQEAVIRKALENSGVSPDQIQYVETHGTGTVLGDPIEMSALGNVLCRERMEPLFIGSVKTNLGHLSSAAGIASLIKTVLSLENKEIPPNLNFTEPNSHIPWNKFPFTVPTASTPWNTNVESRMAGVSAFGMTGTNVHMILEEAAPTKKLFYNEHEPRIFVLSAKNEERLRAYAVKMTQFLDLKPATISLADLTYTLQTGRKAMDERLAAVINTPEELQSKLAEYLQGKKDIKGFYNGSVKNTKILSGLLTEGTTGKTFLKMLAKERRLDKIAQLWVSGADIDWHSIYPFDPPQHVPVPTYPFAKERCWRNEVKNKKGKNKKKISVLHPLLHKNTSDLTGQRFSSIFKGNEIFFLTDDAIESRRILPGAAYLEMVRAAVEQAAGVSIDDRKKITLKNVVWAEQITLGKNPVDVHVRLFPDENEEIVYEIYSKSSEENLSLVVHAQGSIALNVAGEVPALDIESLQAECDQKRSGSDEYSERQKGIKKIYFGERQALAKLTVPYPALETADEFILHPGLIHTSLQVAGWIAGLGGLDRSELYDCTGSVPFLLPFALEKLEILDRCTSSMWAFIRHGKECLAGNTVKNVDIDLCDEHGRLCARMEGFTSKLQRPDAELSGTLMFRPVWKEKAAYTQDSIDYEKRIIALCEPDGAFCKNIENGTKSTRVIILESKNEKLESKNENIDKRFSDFALRLFEDIQVILKSKPKGKTLFQVVIFAKKDQSLFSGFSGLLKTAHSENPKFIGQLIQINEDLPIQAILEENINHPEDRLIKYEAGRRFVAAFEEVKYLSEKPAIVWKDKGVYLITGGAGGLGLIFAKEIAVQAKNPVLILMGRSELDEDKKTRIEELNSTGARVEYIRADVTQKSDVENTIRNIEKKIGKINGIIHSAGIISDNFIIRKKREEFEKVLAPKVTGLANIDHASRDLQLDFFFIFSSGTGVLGNTGQADYACGNAFMDAYAEYRNDLVKEKKRNGKTFSINWPLWKDGGMKVDGRTEKMIMQSSGMAAMKTETGIRAFYQVFSLDQPQIMTIYGNLSLLRKFMQKTAYEMSASEARNSKLQVDSELLREKTEYNLKHLFGEITNVRIADIDFDEPFESYGIDSIMIIQFNQELETIFTDVSKTLFYEYKTLRELTQHFISDYPQECIRWSGLDKQAISPPSPSAISCNEPYSKEIFPELTSFTRAKYPKFGNMGKPARAACEPVAIIGMSGRYPQAENLDQYWENLKTGNDCITEIPKKRWSLEGFFNPDPDEALTQGKSYSKWGGFLDRFADFDPLFFNISPKEAIGMDPQERLFIEACWEVFEDAGYTKDLLKKEYNGRVGVFAGITKTGFDLYGSDLRKNGENIHLRTSFGSLANRISYLLDLKGPSMPVDTMCSSSLTAIHEACEHLYSDECEMAVAGGVNLYLHPSSYVELCAMRMLTPDSKCKSFGKGGDGFLPGEGVGVVLLKRISKALEDRDNIYAVIRGTGINHGGKTSGYTVPNPTAQGELIRTVMDKAGVKAREISYIEAHGTGTELGDPIEITGLTQAFGKDTDETNFCSIGSAKSNIGHLEAAAGIAGLTKIVMQMKNKKLVPSLHSRELNPNINFSKTPFIVQQELADWKCPVISGKEVSRIAGISSLGAGGANAHVLIEEYVEDSTIQQNDKSIKSKFPHIFLLSAKNGERLKVYAGTILDFLNSKIGAEDGPYDLTDMSYTLQVGREAMEERLAMIVTSAEELRDNLNNFINDQDDMEFYYRGSLKQNKDILAVYDADDDMQNMIDAWIAKKKYSKLLSFWVKGLVFDWDKLYGKVKPKRISLPTYPFAKETYWIDTIRDKKSEDRCEKNIAMLHPLLHENTSDLTEQRFTTTFTGNEFFLADHVVDGRRILPGVAYLEMARAAIERAAGISGDERTTIWLKNIVWASPVAIENDPVDIHIGLFPDENGEIGYSIYSQSKYDAEPVIHSQGSAELHTTDVEIPAMDIESLRLECGLKAIASDDCYEAFAKIGLEYGPGQRGLEAVYVGKNQALAQLTIPSSVLDTADQFILHPSVMDSALQASIGLATGLTTDSGIILEPALPFSLERLEIFGGLTPLMWTFVKYAKGSLPSDNLKKLDIDLCNSQGQIRVRMKGFSSRTFKKEGQRASSALSSAKTTMLTPVWDSLPIIEEKRFLLKTEKLLIVGGDSACLNSVAKLYPDADIFSIQPGDTIEAVCKQLETHGVAEHILWIAPHVSFKSLADDMLIKEQETGILALFRTIKALVESGYDNKKLDWTIITSKTQYVIEDDLVDPCHASIHGLVGSMSKEYPNWKIRLVDLESPSHFPFNDIFRLPPDSRGNALCYRDSEWYRQKLIPLSDPLTDKPLYRQEGVYVVIGGAGGIGTVWSEYMIRNYQAKIVWIGRKKENEIIREKIEILGKAGTAPIYISADAADLNSLKKAYEKIKEKYSHIQGVVHSAIVLADKSLGNMEEDRFRIALAAKVDVSVRMVQVFQKEPLDFILFFSALQSFLKQPGQSNYAAGCTFKDSFARSLSQKMSCTVKIMNWGYWGTEGIVASKEYRERMEDLGVGSIEHDEGMEALDILMSCNRTQIALNKTDKSSDFEEIDYEESITDYPRHVSHIKNTIENLLKKLHDFETFNSNIIEYTKEMEELLFKLLCGQLEKLKNESLLKLYDRWLEESEAVVNRKKYLADKESPFDIEALWKEWNSKKEKWLEEPDMKAQVGLVQATMMALPSILVGKTPAADIIFPDSSMKLVEGLYKNNRTSDYFNKVLCHTLTAYIQERLHHDPSAKLRILEIGAGTGGTSAILFPELKKYAENISEYCYTDISKAFLIHAEKEYGQENPYLVYKIFDVERPLKEQDMETGAYDIVFASNVLHATKNIRNTVRNTKAALRHNGLLVLNEMSTNNLFAHLTFGLLEGWWLYEDKTLRIDGCPGLSSETWQKVLEQEGFSSIFFPAQQALDYGQQIIVCESDGVARQKSSHKRIIDDVPQKTVKNSLKKEPRGFLNSETERWDIGNETIRFLKDIIGESIRLAPDNIRSDEKLERYGLDSILIVNLLNRLSKAFGSLPRTLFFEYVDIKGLADYFIKEHEEKLIELLRLERKTSDSTYKIDGEIGGELESLGKNGKTRIQFTRGNINKSMTKKNESEKCHDIAIIGVSGRYPGADTLEDFWNILLRGEHCFEKVPSERWSHDELYCNDVGILGKSSIKTGSFIRDIDKFDPRYFSISKRDAELMSPEVRLFLQVGVEAFEDAGYSKEYLQKKYNGDVGVLAGSVQNDYILYGFQNALIRGSVVSSNMEGLLAAMLSYFYGFTGPSIHIDTMCTTASICIHQAVHMLRSGQCKMVIAGGVHLFVHPYGMIANSQAPFATKTSEVIKSYGQGVDGTVIGEGVGAVILKPFEEAVKDRDHIYAVIKGTGATNAGIRNGFTVPDPNMQALAIEKALEDAQIDPRTISYLEGHGSGTVLGDPIEIRGAAAAYENYKHADHNHAGHDDHDNHDTQFCPIGSVKSNMGHLVAVAGMAGLTKVLLQLKHKKIVASLHSKELNPNIDFKQTPFYVPQQLSDWKRPVIIENGEEHVYPRRAGITSIAGGGMNSHIIVEECKAYKTDFVTNSNDTRYLMIFSAMNKERVVFYLKKIELYLSKNVNTDIRSLSYTLQVGKNELPCRLAIVANDIKDLSIKIRSFINETESFSQKSAQPDIRFTENVLNGELIIDQERVYKDIRDKNMEKISEYWVNGIKMDWDALYGDMKPEKISLPAYPFEKVRCWYQEYEDAPTVMNPTAFKNKLHPFVGRNDSDLYSMKYTTDFRIDELLDYAFHIDKTRNIIATCFIDTAFAVADLAGLQGKIALRDLKWNSPLDWKAITRLNISLVPDDKNGIIVIFTSKKENQEEIIFQASFRQNNTKGIQTEQEKTEDLNLLKGNAYKIIEKTKLYEKLSTSGFDYKPFIEGVKRVYLTSANSLLIDIEEPLHKQNHHKKRVRLSPVVLGAIIQGVQYFTLERQVEESLHHIPQHIQEVELFGKKPEISHILFHFNSTEKKMNANILLLDKDGKISGVLSNVEFHNPLNIYEKQHVIIDNPVIEEPDKENEVNEENEASENLIHELRKIIAGISKFDIEDIELNTDFYSFGFDSIALTSLTGEINKEFDIELTPAVFFESENIEELADYMLKHHSDLLKNVRNESKIDKHAIRNENKQKFLQQHKNLQHENLQHENNVFNQCTEFPAFENRLFREYRTHDRQTPIAVIGAAGKFPGSDNIAELWANIINGKDMISPFPLERYDEFYKKIILSSKFPKYAGVIDDVDKFDAEFFNISPREAELMDPQHRLMLETVWGALEDSGYNPYSLPYNTSIFIGITGMDYADLLSAHNVPPDAFTNMGLGQMMLPNRISFLLDIHGPSEPVNTACSSALVAIHRAVEVLRSGQSDLAVAGGVNLLLSSNVATSIDMTGALSPDGKCKTFSKDANGYVRGEGVAAIILKPLEKAVKDHDNILGVIIGSSENHGGKAASLTAPNAKSQARLIEDAMEGIDPQTISYIETHGTGTSLGDPVEINGLKSAFGAGMKKFSKGPVEKAFCGLGSLKTNIGHLESAAGIAGVIKVMLAMKHRELPETLHCQELNPYIDLNNSPFYIVDKKRAWDVPCDIHGDPVPRRAGISSFGFGGSNAHVIIEEYVEKETTQLKHSDNATELAIPRIFVLSAKNADRLKVYAENVLFFLDAESGKKAGNPDLADIAYTFQVGREAMEERLGVIVNSVEALKDKLKRFVDRENKIDDLYCGNAGQSKDTLAVFDADEDMEKIIEAWVAKRKYSKLLSLWVKGLEFDWNILYGELKPRRISLPTYPFEKVRYWMPESSGSSPVVNNSLSENRLHPFLHRNTSDFSEQRFSSIFTGEESFLADHVVKGRKILPGVAYLEMARAAVEQASGISENERAEITLKNVIWIEPIAVKDDPVNVHIRLFPDGNKKITFEIYSKSDKDGNDVIHGQGVALLNIVEEFPDLDIESLKVECNQERYNCDECYSVFAKIGLEYGAGYRGIEKIYVGEDLALAHLTLPASVFDTADRFVLHPGLMDSALQASIGLVIGSGKLEPALPFALEQIDILSECTSSMWAFVRHSEGSVSDKVRKFDVDLCDEKGKVCVRIKRFSSRKFKDNSQAGLVPSKISDLSKISDSSEISEKMPFGTTMLAPVWNTFEIKKREIFPARTDRILIAGGNENTQKEILKFYPQAMILNVKAGDTVNTMIEQLEKRGLTDHIIWITPSDSLQSNDDGGYTTLIEEQERGVIALFRMIKAILAIGYGSKNLSWSVITVKTQSVLKSDAFNPAHASVHGLIGSMAKEYPGWKIRLIDLESESEFNCSDIFAIPPDQTGNASFYRDKFWYKEELVPVRDFKPEKSLYRENKVYVVIGGAGGIGVVWSEYMIRRYKARVIWIGRRKKDDEIEAKIRSVGSPEPLYIEADASDANALQKAYEEIKDRYSEINGIVHSSIVLSDKSLMNMEEERFRASLSAKVDVSVCMSQIFGKEPLDFMLFFSSMQSFKKAAGQSNYAAGCTFKDAFAQRLSLDAGYPVKVMNWGYWGSIGVAASKEYNDRMAEQGIGSIEPEEGMEALEKLFDDHFDRLAFIKSTESCDWQGINTRESINICPQSASLNMKNILDGILKRDIEKIRKTSDRQTKLDKLALQLMHRQLQAAGLFVDKKQKLKVIKKGTGIIDLYDRWLEATLTFFTREKEISPVHIDTLWKKWDKKKNVWSRYPVIKARAELVEATLRSLPEILLGKIPVTNIMFPKSSMELVEGVYKNNEIADYFNDVVADIISSYIEEKLKHDSKAKIRIFEIGAGTGGTSAVIFDALKPYKKSIQEYCYTDISKAFLMHAEETYGKANPYLTYKIFNIEKPVEEQSVETAGYDIVVAANVLHATRNIRQTIRNAKAVLKNGGSILLNEFLENSLFAHLTFGLLEGWWLYEDPELRIPGCPGLAPATWKKILEQEGFVSTSFPAEHAHDFGQQIIVAKSDGIIRQERSETSLVSVKRIHRKEKEQNQSSHNLKIGHNLKICMVAYLKKLVSNTLKMNEDMVDTDKSLDKYGLDSIVVLEINNELERDFPDLSKTLFFEYGTVNELAEYFVKSHKKILIEMFTGQAHDSQGHQQSVAAESDDVVTPEMDKTNQVSANRIRRKEKEPDLSLQDLKIGMVAYLKRLVSNTLKMNEDMVDTDKSLDKYGLDSIVVLEINNELDRHFPDLSKTLFFEYSTVGELAEYFVKSHKRTLIKMLDTDETLNRKIGFQQNNLYSNHNERTSFSKPKRVEYLKNQNEEIRIGEQKMPLEQKSRIQSADRKEIMAILAGQIENHNLYIDDIIDMKHSDIITSYGRK